MLIKPMRFVGWFHVPSGNGLKERKKMSSVFKSSFIKPTRESLFRPFEDSFNKFFEDFFGSTEIPKLGVAAFPKLNISKSQDEFVIEVACPGMSQEDICLEVLTPEQASWSLGSNNRVLKISGKMAKIFQRPSDDYLIKELSTAKFERMIGLPDYVFGDPDAILKLGILYLVWKIRPKEEKVEEPRKIPIRS